MKTRLLLSLLAISLSATAQYYNHVQMMHNSADTSVKHLKLWINDTVWMPQFDYLMSTPQVSLGPGVHTVGVSPPGATSQAQCIAQTTLDNSNTNYSSAFLAVTGIHDPGPQYNLGSAIKPFGIYTYTAHPFMGEPSPIMCITIFSHLSTDIASLTVVSGTTTFANALDYKNSKMSSGIATPPYGSTSLTVAVSSPSGAIGIGTITLHGQKKIFFVSTGFTDTLANARVKGGGKKFMLAALPVAGGKAIEIPISMPDATAGIGEVTPLPALRLYPSPVKDRLFVKLEGRTNIDVNIHDIFGRLVCSKSIAAAGEYIDLKDLAPGSYVVKVTDGVKVFTAKVLVE